MAHEHRRDLVKVGRLPVLRRGGGTLGFAEFAKALLCRLQRGGAAENTRVGIHDLLQRPTNDVRKQPVTGCRGLRLAHGRRVVSHGHDDPPSEHQTLEEGVRSQAIRTVDAGARDLAARVEARNRRSAPQVGSHPTGDVVLRRGHRDQIGDRVDPARATGLQDRREPLQPRVGAEPTTVQPHVRAAF